MDSKIQIIIYLLGYFIVIFSIAYYFSRNQTKEDFLVSSRNRGWLSIAMSKYSTSIGASWFISYTAFIYQFGIGVFGAVIGYLISMLILAYYISPKLHDLSKEKKFLKIGEVVEYKTGSKTLAKTTNIFGSAINMSWLLVTVSGGANLITYFGILNYEFALISMISFVLLYLFLGGYKGVITTDVIQGLFILIILSVISVYIFNQTSIEQLQTAEFDKISIGTVVGFLIFGAFSVFSYIDRYQLIFSGKNTKSLQKGFLSVIPLILFSVVLLLIMGYLVRLQVPGIDPSLVFTKAIELYLPASIIPIALVMFFAAVMSSFDSYIYSISSHLNLFNVKDKIKNIKINSVFISLIAMIICYYQRDIINITIIAAGLSVILSAPMIYLFWGKVFVGTQKLPSRFLFSLIGSLTGLLLGIAFMGLSPNVAAIPLVFGLVGLMFKSKYLDKVLSGINEK